MAAKVSLVPHVIDALLTKFRALSVTITDAQGQTLPKTPIVYDGLPPAGFDDVVICVGGGLDPTADSNQTWASLGQPGAVGGAPARDERAIVRCYASSFIGGDDTSAQDNATITDSISDAQKKARDNAYSIVNAAEVALRSDPQLLGLGGAAPGVALLGTGWVEFVAGTLHQTNETDESATQGRYATVEFAVGWFSRLYSL